MRITKRELAGRIEGMTLRRHRLSTSLPIVSKALALPHCLLRTQDKAFSLKKNCEIDRVAGRSAMRHLECEYGKKSALAKTNRARAGLRTSYLHVCVPASTSHGNREGASRLTEELDRSAAAAALNVREQSLVI